MNTHRMNVHILALQLVLNKPNTASEKNMTQSNENANQSSQGQVCRFIYCKGLLLPLEEFTVCRQMYLLPRQITSLREPKHKI